MDPQNKLGNEGFTKSSFDVENSLDFFQLKTEKENLQKLSQVSQILQATYLQNKEWSGNKNVVATLLKFHKWLKEAKSALDLCNKVALSSLKEFDSDDRQKVDIELGYWVDNGEKLSKIYTNLAPLFEAVCQKAEDSILSAINDRGRRISPNTLQKLLKIKCILENTGIFFNKIKAQCDEMTSLAANCQKFLNKGIEDMTKSKWEASITLWVGIGTICDVASNAINSAEIVTDKIMGNLENKPKQNTQKAQKHRQPHRQEHRSIKNH